MIIEASRRGIKTDKNQENILRLRHTKGSEWGMGLPKWMGVKDVAKRVTTTHKANLYKKQPEAYPQFYKALESKSNTPCCDTCQYFWVTHYDANLV
jgi:hypothetical protein